MKTNRRNSKLKRIKMTGFRRRRRTRGGQAILAQRRRTDKPKTAAKRRRVRRAQAHRQGFPK